MDFDTIATSIGHQLAVVANAPAPFIACVLIAAFFIWKAMGWRYDSIIGRLKADVAYFERALVREVKEPERPPAALLPKPTYMPTTRSPLTPEDGERVFVRPGMTPASLAEGWEELTGFQADGIRKTYVGKWMAVTSTVHKTGVTDGEAYVVIDVDTTKPPRQMLREQVTLWFEKEHDKIETLRPGDPVSAVGQIESINDFGFILVRCEFTA